VLIQGGEERSRVSFQDKEGLDVLLNQFINYTRPEVKDFWGAIAAFKQDLPLILESLRELIATQDKTNKAFQVASREFLDVCQTAINPQITAEDIREMIIQHILTEDIFLNIFNLAEFHRNNSIATQLEKVIKTFFTGNKKLNILATIQRYYAVIKRTAAQISNHQEKQKFLKAVYENFYQAYNPKAADRLGIVYTPSEIVRFMIASTDYLLHQHFGKLLSDPGVEILDPATGTGTFICELIEYLAPDKLKAKYQEEIFANEVAILPYYIANLNIEFNYLHKMGEYVDFKHLCCVDTLEDNSFEFKGGDLSSLTVIIGNPPYNANQANENDNNKNRAYPAIDRRLKDTYIKASSAQKTKLYDMYSRFIRWASDRIATNGLIAFVTNSSFIDTKTFDGFRKIVAEEFQEIYVIDLGGNVRVNPKLSGTKHNVFGIQTGVAISLFVKVENPSHQPCKIYYARFGEEETAEAKLEYLRETKFSQLSFTHIIPDKQHNWINQTYNDFESLIPLVDKEVKAGKNEGAIFQLYSNGIVTARDEWVYDLSEINLLNKVKFFLEVYQQEQHRWLNSDKKTAINDFVDRQIKWTSELEGFVTKNISLIFQPNCIKASLYRPYNLKLVYFDKIIIHRLYQQHLLFPVGENEENILIGFSGLASSKPFQCLATNHVGGFDLLEKTQYLPLYYYDKEGNRQDNITNWGLTQFQTHYQNPSITKVDIFNYTYAVLHYPSYREKYQLNLKRDFPRLPFYGDFFKWVNSGQQLMNLHINYENVSPYPLTRVDLKKDGAIKVKLKADQTAGMIIIDDVTSLSGIPSETWEYRLGNRSPLEWVLDQYKEKTPKDTTIAVEFNTYRFADYKEQVIDLLQRLITVSVETMRIIKNL